MARTHPRLRGHKLIRWAVWWLTFGLTALACPHTNLPVEIGSAFTAAPGGVGSVQRLAWGLQIGVGAWAQDLTFSAKVDKTTVDLGDPITLTLTLSGDVAGVQWPTPEFPEAFAVASRSQATNFSIQAGTIERSTNLLYVLIPQRAGTFRLGPFRLRRGNNTIQTEPIDITVKKGAVPQDLQPHGERYTL